MDRLFREGTKGRLNRWLSGKFCAVYQKPWPLTSPVGRDVGSTTDCLLTSGLAPRALFHDRVTCAQGASGEI